MGSVPLNTYVSFTKDTKICLESPPGMSEKPMVTLGLNIQISVQDLVTALLEFQTAHEPPTKPEAKVAPSPQALPSHVDRPQPHSVPVGGSVPVVPPHNLPPSPPPVTHVPTPVAAAAGAAQGATPDSSSTRAASTAEPASQSRHQQLPPSPLKKIDWTTPISDLFSHDAYLRKTQWQADEGSWKLTDVSCLLDFNWKPLEPIEPPRRGRMAFDSVAAAACGPAGEPKSGAVPPPRMSEPNPGAISSKDEDVTAGIAGAVSSKDEWAQAEGKSPVALSPPPAMPPPPPPPSGGEGSPQAAARAGAGVSAPPGLPRPKGASVHSAAAGRGQGECPSN